METDKVKVDGDTVTIKAKSADTARQIGAAAEDELLKKEGGFSGLIDRFLDGMGNVTDTIGRPSFGWIAWALAVVGSVIAFISWSRILPSKDLAWLFGVVGVCIILGTKLAAGRWASALNVSDTEQSKYWSWVALAGLVINFVAALGFQAAVTADEETGAYDIGIEISQLEREVRQANFELNSMQKPPDTAETLQLDLDLALKQQALTNEGNPARLTVGEVIAWDTDDYCMPGGNYASYVDRYCPDVIDLQKQLQRRISYEEAVAARDAKNAQIQTLKDSRPQTSSSTALGNQLASEGGAWRKNLPGALLMLIIELAMVVAAFTAKRHPKGVRKAGA
ncbi:MAG: hypothetical protein AAFV38_11215 [Pseudomonadota bacterium]